MAPFPTTWSPKDYGYDYGEGKKGRGREGGNYSWCEGQDGEGEDYLFFSVTMSVWQVIGSLINYLQNGDWNLSLIHIQDDIHI